MISQDLAYELVRNIRAAINDGGPRDAEGFRWYAETLMDCPNERFARNMVRNIVQDFKRFPAIADLRNLMRAEMAQTQEKRSWTEAPKCPMCVEGWRHVWALCDMRGGRPVGEERITEEQYHSLAEQLAKQNNPQQCVYQGVERCECGQAVRRAG